MDLNDRDWTVYVRDECGYPRRVQEGLCEQDAFLELEILRQAGARCWREKE